MEHATADIFIVRIGDGWKILSGAASLGGFAYRSEAETRALGLAERVKAHGQAVRVYVQDAAGELSRLDS